MTEPRLSHADFNGDLRYRKALKIGALVSRYANLNYKRFLEVGTGAGIIAQYFSNAGYGLSGSYAVDVIDERQVTEGYNFLQVQGTTLPFADEFFDFIISNHVVEHVGSAEDQAHHLREIFRCLDSGGVFYFAVPNRWRLIEPHYKLPLLSWLPGKIASNYVRLFKRGSCYDCKPLSHRDAISLLNHSGFDFVDATLDAIPIFGEIEGSWLTWCITRIPKAFWGLFSALIPTYIFVCRKP
jgi:SAM-dependent methyltransferase